MKRVAAFLMSTALLAAPAFARGGGGHAGHGGGHSRSTHVTPHHAKTKSSTTKTDKVHVNGYVTKTGRHVEAHDRTRGNQSKTDNWSTKTNVHPETGEAGMKPPSGKSHV